MTKILHSFNFPYLVVDSLPEYYRAKKHTNSKFLLLWETNPANYAQIDTNRVALWVFNLSTCKYLVQLDKKFCVHIFCDTWMHREWVGIEELRTIIKYLREHDPKQKVCIEWCMTHFLDSESADQSSMLKQLDVFKDMHKLLLDWWFDIKRRHAWNSWAMLSLHDDFCNAWRVGLAMYWYNPLSIDHPDYDCGQKLKPALDIYSHVVAKHVIQTWDSVSYNATWLAKKDNTTIITLPFGYREWLPRSVSNKIMYRVWDTYIEQVWTICMNLSSAVLPSDCIVKVWDEVSIISSDPHAKNSMLALQSASDTIIYELLISLDDTMRREIVSD